ncbi:MAG: aminodeoxychorismate/anthranilate synthase component II [Bacteroides sp.]|nr:aminodeoxychorismate/anthranilate synthase component II [Bacteroides sp.]
MDNKQQRILVVDNHDSFTYNLVHLIHELNEGIAVNVVKNDAIALNEIDFFDKIVLSPGPGIPREAGLLLSIIRRYAGFKPILGVCLGHQAIGEAFGAQLENLPQVHHGQQSIIQVMNDSPLFQNLGSTLQVGRYHSWVVSHNEFPTCLKITAQSEEGEIMALEHREKAVYGIQFHPESVLTPLGGKIINNFLNYNS